MNYKDIVLKLLNRCVNLKDNGYPDYDILIDTPNEVCIRIGKCQIIRESTSDDNNNILWERILIYLFKQGLNKTQETWNKIHNKEL